MPHHVPLAKPTQKGKSRDFKEFAITRNAFLPAESPSELLSDPYYEPWELVAQQLSVLIDRGDIRDTVDRLPTLQTDRLTSKAEWRRAYVILAFIAHAYIWGGDKPEEVLPPQITVPFLRVSTHLDLPPVLTYAAANLWNFACPGNDFSHPEDLKTLVSFTGTESESWFLLISVAMEARGAGIINVMMEAIEALEARDYDIITCALEELHYCIQDVSRLLERMYERCDPMTFYHRIRPFLAGSKNMAGAGLPRGVFYDEGDGRGRWREYAGGSNGQSSLIQFFDIVLGVDHKGNGNDTPSSGEKSYHTEVREYMPGPHRQFLLHAASLGSIRELALLPPKTDEQRRLRMAYTAATEALSGFRNLHIQIRHQRDLELRGATPFACSSASPVAVTALAAPPAEAGKAPFLVPKRFAPGWCIFPYSRGGVADWHGLEDPDGDVGRRLPEDDGGKPVYPFYTFSQTDVKGELDKITSDIEELEHPLYLSYIKVSTGTNTHRLGGWTFMHGNQGWSCEEVNQCKASTKATLGSTDSSSRFQRNYDCGFTC